MIPKIVILLLAVIVYAVCIQASATGCGFPGLPIDGEVDGDVDWESNAIFYSPGKSFTYSCNKPSDALRGSRLRTCQQDGTWSGYRPFCESNVAAGKSVTYNGPKKHQHHHHGDPQLLTDGFTEPEDQECFKMGPGGDEESSLHLHLDQQAAVRTVIFHLKDDKEVKHLEGDQMTLEDADTPLECHRQVESPVRTAAIYRCLSSNEGVDLQSNKGKSIRFQHKNSHSVSICEVQVFANPLKFHCGLPEVPANGQVNISRVFYNDETFYEMARYECSEGFRLEGSERRVCHGRHWQGKQAVCVAKEDKQLTNEIDPASSEESKEDKDVEDIKLTIYTDESRDDNGTPLIKSPPVGISEDVLDLEGTVEFRMQVLRVVLFALSGLLIFLGLVLASLFFFYQRRNGPQYRAVVAEPEEVATEAAKDTEPLRVVYVSESDPDPSGYLARVIKKAYQSIRNV